jgi:hypothetical protein
MLVGAAFIIPYALHDFPAEVDSVFRYLVYGITDCCFTTIGWVM